LIPKLTWKGGFSRLLHAALKQEAAGELLAVSLGGHPAAQAPRQYKTTDRYSVHEYTARFSF